jgi:hypothetical protein
MSSTTKSQEVIFFLKVRGFVLELSIFMDAEGRARVAASF